MKKICMLLFALFLLAACSLEQESDGNTATERADQKETVATEAAAAETESTEEPERRETAEDPFPNTEATADPETVDLSVEPSEGGRIMVLMYHNIGEEEEDWVRTPDKFREDLQILYDQGYRPVRLTDYVNGHIDVPAGMTPFVITFDDVRENNFRYLDDGSIDPDCAVGILLDFAQSHEGFAPHATFFANADVPFRVEGEEQQKVEFLLANGMDIGNHTVGHEDFTYIDAQDLQQTIGAQAQYLETLTPDDYKVNTLALPFGSRPQDDSLTPYLKEGSYNGFHYENIAILNVGWDPGYSPFHRDFDPEFIPRIRASEMNVDNVGIRDWLQYFENHPEERYISDGNPQIVSAPRDWEDVIQVPEGKVLNLYETASEED